MIQNGVKIEQKEVVNRLKRNGHGYLYEKYTKQKVTDKIRGLLTTHTGNGEVSYLKFLRNLSFIRLTLEDRAS